MKRRTFSALTLGSLSSMSFAPVEAQTGFKEGTDYFKLSQAVPTEVAKGRVEVLEFFWYNCPHCNAFEPTLSAWSKTAQRSRTQARACAFSRRIRTPATRLLRARSLG
jgi:thiol:disulfide interchange protein DsbA